ncbi:RNA polymerase sigma factor [bacterium]|jgi:RNA polymerase sigma-70 factor (ECF subfamily)|nr:RNA polymerase sigma factor [Planctomycetota bacterium]MDB4538674.1 RNA polymerase sigma factor [bacterium]
MPGPLKTDPDRDLILECQRSLGEGFGGAFRQVYELYKDRVYNVCYRVTGNATDALDASQETFGIVHRKISAFRFESRFSSWVYRIAVNASIDIKRRAAARSVTSLEALQAPLDREGGSFDVEDERTEAPTDFASRHELEQDIQRSIDRLSPKMRTIIVLRYLESLSYDEIAETLTISLGTVKSRLSRAHAALDRELTPIVDRHFIHEEGR